MAGKSKKQLALSEPTNSTSGDSDDSFSDEFVADLIKQFNKDAQRDTAHHLDDPEANVKIKRWISTGSRLLDYCISNRRDGGIPEGRIIEIFGKYSSGKSLLAFQLAKNCQKMGGMVFYFDVEHSVVPEYLTQLGITKKNFVLIDDKYITEEVFQDIENLIVKINASGKKNKPPVLVIVDSIAALVPKAEQEADYEQQTMGLQARTLSKALRKITPIISTEAVTLVLLNQIRARIKQNPFDFGPAEDSTGGNALKFFCSVRINMDGSSKLKPSKDSDEIIGIRAVAKLEKNKVSSPGRKCDFQIIFGKGIEEHNEILDAMIAAGPRMIGTKRICVSGAAWRNIKAEDVSTGEIFCDKTFRTAEFKKMLKDPEFQPHLDELLDNIMIKSFEPQTDDDKDISSLASGSSSET